MFDIVAVQTLQRIFEKKAPGIVTILILLQSWTKNGEEMEVCNREVE